MSAPIPLYLLGDTAAVYAWDEKSPYGNHYGEPLVYSHVRLDTAIKATNSVWANDETVDAVLFVDAVNSSPAKPPALRSKVEVMRGETTYSGIVQSAKECIDEGSHIHHWEVGLG